MQKMFYIYRVTRWFNGQPAEVVRHGSNVFISRLEALRQIDREYQSASQTPKYYRFHGLCSGYAVYECKDQSLTDFLLVAPSDAKFGQRVRGLPFEARR